MDDIKTYSLKEEAVYTEMRIDKEAAQYQKGPNEGKNYFRAYYKGKTFTVAPDFQAAYEAGDIAEITLADNIFDREIDDPEHPGEKLKVPTQSYSVSGYATWPQLEKLDNALNKRKKGKAINDLQIKVEKKKVIDSMELDENQVKELLAEL